MSIKYIFDTSTVRCLSKDAIETLCEKLKKLYVSSYSFWEILPHLHEDFGRWKKELLKFEKFNILDDPYVCVDKIFLSNSPELRDRSTDSDIIYQTITRLQSSTSIKDFYEIDIVDSKGHYRKIGPYQKTLGCSERAQDSLSKSKTEYIEFVGPIIEGFKKGTIEIPDRIEDYHERVMELIEGQVIKYRKNKSLVRNLRHKAINSFYIFFSYILHRALKYYESNTDIKEINKNDYVDSSICLHLRLQTSYCLVAEDKRLREALVKTISILNKLNKTKFKNSLIVKKLNDLN